MLSFFSANTACMENSGSINMGRDLTSLVEEPTEIVSSSREVSFPPFLFFFAIFCFDLFGYTYRRNPVCGGGGGADRKRLPIKKK